MHKEGFKWYVEVGGAGGVRDVENQSTKEPFPFLKYILRKINFKQV